MTKVADVRLGWSRSVSSDVAKVNIELTVDGDTQTTELGPEVEEFMITVRAGGSVQFRLTTFDSEGLQSMSATYDFTLGDLESPLPATDLFHEIVAIRDVDE